MVVGVNLLPDRFGVERLEEDGIRLHDIAFLFVEIDFIGNFFGFLGLVFREIDIGQVEIRVEVVGADADGIAEVSFGSRKVMGLVVFVKAEVV